ncbi:MAG: hypothetical protein JKY02_10500 [Flavobacteriaceae bacterium]|nr:hypothetical protein [Flavobacteriaceae bacterium]
MITSGEVDVFYVNIGENGDYLSTLKYLYSAKAGELLFSLMTSENKQGENYKLIAISKGASVVVINKNKLLEINHLFLKSMIDKWVLKTTSRIQQTNSPRIYTTIEPSKGISLKKGTIAYPSKGLLWCSLIKGEYSLYSENKLLTSDSEFNYPFAVSKNLWIKALSDDIEIRVLNTKEALKDEIDFMRALNNLQSYLYTKMLKNNTSEIEEEKNRIKEKVTSEAFNLENTLEELRTIVVGKKDKSIALPTNSKNLNNDLFSTCQLIGDAVGFQFEAPKFMESYKNSTTNQLYAIAQSSKVRVRKIILRGTWWKEENGHLLAFHKKDKRPVALIQNSPNSYFIKDVSTAEEQKVDFKIAEQLEPICYMIFYGFNDTMTSIKKIGGFAAKGLKKDSKHLILAALFGSIIGLLVPILSGVMFDDVIPSADKSLHVEVFAIMLMIGLVSAGLQLVQGVLLLRVESKSSINLQAGVMDHLLRLPVTFFKKFSAGDLTNRALSINAIRQILSSTVMTAVLSGAFSFVNLGLLFYYKSSLAWIGLSLAGIAVVL